MTGRRVPAAGASCVLRKHVKWAARERGAWGRLGVFGLRHQEGELASVGEK